MALAIVLLTVVVALLCAAGNASDFPPMRGLLVLVQLALVVVREILMVLLIARQSRWLAAAYLVAAGAAFLCLLASQHGYTGLPEYALALAPVAAFGIPMASLAVAQWRHPAAWVLLAVMIGAAVAVDAHIVPGILKQEGQPAKIPLAAGEPLEAWWPYLQSPQREQVIAVLRERIGLERDLVSAMDSTEPLEILHAFDYISALTPPPSEALLAAFARGQKTLGAKVTPQTREAWQIRTRHAAEALKSSPSPSGVPRSPERRDPQ